MWIAASIISEKLFSVSGTGIELFELTEEDLIWEIVYSVTFNPSKHT